MMEFGKLGLRPAPKARRDLLDGTKQQSCPSKGESGPSGLQLGRPRNFLMISRRSFAYSSMISRNSVDCDHFGLRSVYLGSVFHLHALTVRVSQEEPLR
jgi:hypothetical protein